MTRRGRGRPKRTPHPFEADPRLTDQLAARTIEAYGRVFDRIDDSPHDPAEWLRHLITSKAQAAKKHADPSLAMPKKTLTVYRSAVAWYLHLDGDDRPVREIAKSLPSTTMLRDGVDRTALTPAQLDRYRDLSEAAPDPYRTILLLLPLTGCRISELCDLEHALVDRARRTIIVEGKFAKKRPIELGTAGWTVLSKYLSRHAPMGALVFMVDETIKGTPVEPRRVSPRDVWAIVQSWETDRLRDGLLHGVSLHQLRHTAATKMVRGGIPLTRVQTILGHKSIDTLSRYVHDDDAEERRAAMELLE